MFPLFYFKFEVRFARFVLLCSDGTVFTSVFIWLLFAFFSRREVCICLLLNLGFVFFFALASFLFFGVCFCLPLHCSDGILCLFVCLLLFRSVPSMCEVCPIFEEVKISASRAVAAFLRSLMLAVDIDMESYQYLTH